MTNIVAFELIAAVVAILTFSSVIPADLDIHHFIDSTPDLNCVIKGFSRQSDLCSLVGQLWFRASSRMSALWAFYVPSACNLADGPSRGDVTLMQKIGAEEISAQIPRNLLKINDWMAAPDAARVAC